MIKVKVSRAIPCGRSRVALSCFSSLSGTHFLCKTETDKNAALTTRTGCLANPKHGSNTCCQQFPITRKRVPSKLLLQIAQLSYGCSVFIIITTHVASCLQNLMQAVAMTTRMPEAMNKHRIRNHISHNDCVSGGESAICAC